MGSYTGGERKDRWKAGAAVALVHVVLGAAILSGLGVDTVSRAVERLKTFDVDVPEPPPPPPPPPPPVQERQSAQPEGAPAAPEPSPVVAPEPVVELPIALPIDAAPVAGTGSSSSIGTGGRGTGTGRGLGGSGSGTGAGGSGAGTTPAQLVRNLTRSDYRRIAGGRLPQGAASLALRIGRDGIIDSCQVIASSGDQAVDSALCPLARSRLRFRPARDAQGQPVPYSTNYRATWRPG